MGMKKGENQSKACLFFDDGKEEPHQKTKKEEERKEVEKIEGRKKLYTHTLTSNFVYTKILYNIL